MSESNGCAFCGFELRFLRRKAGTVCKCAQCGYESPPYQVTPKPKRTEIEKAVAKLRYPKRAVMIARQMGVTL
jgi:hypothetical protein